MKFPHRQTGFSLIEVVVAFSIAAASLALLYNIHAGAARAGVVAGEYGIARELARSALAEAIAADGPNGISTGGNSLDGKYSREIAVEALSDPDMPEALSLVRVVVSVRWQSVGGQRSLRLETIKPVDALP